MTLIVAWLRGREALLCWDSAVTGSLGKAPGAIQSSFGELQDVDGTPVEEAAMKLIDATGAPALICGDVTSAMNYHRLVKARVGAGDDLPTAIAALQDHFNGTEPSFSLIFAHVAEGKPQLISYSTSLGVRTLRGPEPRVAVIDGSLPEDFQRIVTTAIRIAQEASVDLGLDGDGELVIVLAVLQTMGICNYLPAFGVGGAFCGAAVGDQGIRWQPEIVYLTTNPQSLAAFVADANSRVSKIDPFEKIRCRIVDGKGLIASSITKEVTILTPPRFIGDGKPEDALGTSDPDVRKWIGVARYYAFIDVSRQRLVLAITRSSPRSALVTVESESGAQGVTMYIDRVITNALLQPVAPGRFEVVGFSDKPTGSVVRRFSASMDLTQPMPPDWWPTRPENAS